MLRKTGKTQYCDGKFACRLYFTGYCCCHSLCHEASFYIAIIMALLMLQDEKSEVLPAETSRVSSALPSLADFPQPRSPTAAVAALQDIIGIESLPDLPEEQPAGSNAVGSDGGAESIAAVQGAPEVRPCGICMMLSICFCKLLQLHREAAVVYACFKRTST